MGVELGFQELNAGSGSREDGDGSEIPIDCKDIDTVVSLNCRVRVGIRG